LEQVGITNLIAVAVAMAVAAGIPALLPHLPLPSVVLELGIGALIGPHVLELVHPGVTLNFLADCGLGDAFPDGRVRDGASRATGAPTARRCLAVFSRRL
jgi:hypothetical protein